MKWCEAKKVEEFAFKNKSFLARKHQKTLENPEVAEKTWEINILMTWVFGDRLLHEFDGFFAEAIDDVVFLN